MDGRSQRREFGDLCRIFADLDPNSDSAPSRILFAVRHRLGDRLGWDSNPNTLPIPGCQETSLRDRLPADLPVDAPGSAGKLPFRPVYRLPQEWALELSNSTVHAVLHLGWVPNPDGSYHGQMGVYVKPRGLLGRPYMAAIAPFRHYVIYPALVRKIGKAWCDRATDNVP